jgi:hypothetical protein
MSKLKKITLHVSPGFTIPAIYQSTHTKDVEQALTLGALFAETVPTTIAAAKDSEFAELLKQKQNEADAKQAELTAELNRIKSTMLESQKEITRLEKEHEKVLREETTSLKKEAAETQKKIIQEVKEHTLQQVERELTALREQNHILELRRTQLEKDRTADLERERISIKESMSLVLAAKQEQLIKSEEMLSKLQEEYKSLNDFLRKKIKPTSSQEKGAEYETIFRDHLLRAYSAIPKFRIHSGSRSSTGHEADFITSFYDTSILWEVKDYSYKVPTKEIEKFLRDVRENKQVSIAVMLSRTTDITGKTSTGDRQFEFEEGVLYVYISRFEFLGDANDLLQSLRPMFEVWKELGKDKASMTTEPLIRELQRSVEEAQARKTEWKTHKARLGEAMSWMSECVEKAEDNVKFLLRRLKGEEPVEVPEDLFRPLEDDRSRETATALLAVTTLSPDHEIQIQELAKAVATHLSISTATATDRIKATLLHVNTPKGKPNTTKGFTLKN